jgi:hypothetical protein
VVAKAWPNPGSAVDVSEERCNHLVSVSKYFWLIAIIVTGINWVMFRKRAQKHIDENPELKEGYEALFRGYTIWMHSPWVVMGCWWG